LKRIVIGAGLIVALVFAAIAVANIRHYHGKVEGGGHLRFVTKVRGDQTIKVKRFVFSRVSMRCDNGASTVGNAGSPPAVASLRSVGADEISIGHFEISDLHGGFPFLMGKSQENSDLAPR